MGSRLTCSLIQEKRSPATCEKRNLLFCLFPVAGQHIFTCDGTRLAHQLENHCTNSNSASSQQVNSSDRCHHSYCTSSLIFKPSNQRRLPPTTSYCPGAESLPLCWFLLDEPVHLGNHCRSMTQDRIKYSILMACSG